MERNFKCRDCGTFFTADDSKWVDCPTCGKDNIEIARPNRHIGRILAAVVAVLAIAGATVLALRLNSGKSESKTPAAEAVVPVETLAVAEDNNEGEREIPFEIDITPFNIKVSIPKADKESRTYSIKAEALYLPKGCTTDFRVYDYRSHALVASNADGDFKGLPAATDDVGSYTVIVYALHGNVLIDSASCDVVGCVKLPEPGMKKLNVAQLQELVDKAVSDGLGSVLTGNEGISPELSLNFDDLRDENSPNSISEMLLAVEMLDLWSGYTVVGAEYDSMNRVSRLTLKPIWK